MYCNGCKVPPYKLLYNGQSPELSNRFQISAQATEEETTGIFNSILCSLLLVTLYAQEISWTTP